jgi:hypothetical protein
VPLAALIIAQDGPEGHEASLGLIPLLGQTVIEFQARQAHAAGATHIIICAAQLPAGLVSALDRLRGQGINASFVRNAREAAESVHPDEDLLLFAEGAIASPARLAALSSSDRPVIVVRAHALETAHLELIDADHVWAGVARIDGTLTRKTAAILGDWSLAPTLLRMAVQGGAERTLIDGMTNGDVHVVRDNQSARQASKFLLGAVPLQQPDAFSRFGVEPVSRLLADVAGRTALPFGLLAALPFAMIIGALGLALIWWIKAALLVFLLVTVPTEAARRLGGASLQMSKALDFHFKVRRWVGRGLILLSAYWLFALGAGWGCIAVALWIVWQLTMNDESGPWHASEESCSLLLLIGLVSGFPISGLIAALLSTLIVPIAKRFASKTTG